MELVWTPDMFGSILTTGYKFWRTNQLHFYLLISAHDATYCSLGHVMMRYCMMRGSSSYLKMIELSFGRSRV